MELNITDLKIYLPLEIYVDTRQFTKIHHPSERIVKTDHNDKLKHFNLQLSLENKYHFINYWDEESNYIDELMLPMNDLSAVTSQFNAACSLYFYSSQPMRKYLEQVVKQMVQDLVINMPLDIALGKLRKSSNLL